MSERLSNFIGGQWVTGQGAGTPLFDPVLGTEIARADATGLDLPAGFAFAREVGGAALRALIGRVGSAPLPQLLAEAEQHIEAHLVSAALRASGQRLDVAAQALQIGPQDLLKRMDRLGIAGPMPTGSEGRPPLLN